MADYTSLIMKDGFKAWSAKPAKQKVDKKPDNRRNGILKQIDLLLSSDLNNMPRSLRGWATSKDTPEQGSITLVTLRTGSRNVRFPGSEDVPITRKKSVAGAFVPTERVKDFYKGLRADVESKKLDSAIAAAWGDGEQGDMLAQPRTRKARNETPEQKAARTAKARATRERNKAAKGQGAPA